jgi:hypothetical protein
MDRDRPTQSFERYAEICWNQTCAPAGLGASPPGEDSITMAAASGAGRTPKTIPEPPATPPAQSARISKVNILMHDPIENLTPEQALEVVLRLCDKGGRIREDVLEVVWKMLGETDLDETADEVFFALDAIDVQDCWDRAGSSRDGYTSPDEAALELIEEALQPFLDQIGRYRELAMSKEEAAYCMGVILGLYRYQHESKSEFRDWSVDIPIECAYDVLNKWRKRGPGSASTMAMDQLIQQHCPNWAGYFLRTGRRS